MDRRRGLRGEYPERDEDLAGTTDQALRFAARLVQAKDDFYRRHGLPHAIDIGVSAGQALLGLMGPKDHRKATAIGEVPGRARRIQAVGKILRLEHGAKDRVIFGAEVAELIGDCRSFRRYESTGHLRDLSDQVIYYLEPEVQAGEAWPKAS